MPRNYQPKAGPKGRAGAPCITCGHTLRAEIDRRLARRGESGESISAIARAYDLKRDALTNHETNHLPKPLAVVAARHAELVEETRELDVLASLGRAAAKAEKMLAACDAWLSDPEDPRRYTLVPRSTEVEIVWVEGDTRRKEKLGRILERIEQVAQGYVSREAVTNAFDAAGLEGEERHDAELVLHLAESYPPLPARYQVELVEAKTADPRKLLLDAVTTLKPVVELLGKAKGVLKPDGGMTVNNFLLDPRWLLARAALAQALQPYPEAAMAAALALERLDAQTPMLPGGAG